MKLVYFSLFWLISWSICFGQQKQLQSGPMVGYCEMTEAMVWVQTKDKATVHLTYYAETDAKQVMASKSVTTSAENGYTAHLIANQLEPGKKYHYTIYINNRKVKLNYPAYFVSKKLWQWRETPPNFRVALGSCNYINESNYDRPGKGYGDNYGIFNAINNQNPDIMLWLGDNIYLREADWDSKSGIYHRYTHTRSIIETQRLLAKTQNFAIWDDHDFGPNDSDRSFYNKNTTLQAFKDFWANKSYGSDSNQNTGNYSTFNWGDAQFFLLDNRFFKSPNDRITDTRTVLGNTQLQWLIDALSYSKATFKIICIGGQVISNAPVFENYATYPEERNELITQIKKNKIKGVLFLSGDRHFAELSKLESSDFYPLYDWTVSPLTSGIADYKNNNNTNSVTGSVFGENNFGLLEFSGTDKNRQLKLSLRNKEGIELWQKIILQTELE